MNLAELPDLVERSFQAVAEIEAWVDDEREGGGTGFVAVLDDRNDSTTSDLVLTNAHVVDAGSDFKISFNDGKESAGTLLGTHPIVDIAVFRLDEVKNGALNLRGQDEFRRGEFVLALGHPQHFSWSVTAGLISGLDRPWPAGHHNSDHLPITMLQTSAEINHGNSGGPLVCLDGKVAGINTSGIIKPNAMFKVNFAIPANSARLAAAAILEAEHADHVPRPWTGLPLRRLPWQATEGVFASYGVKGGAEVSGDPKEGSPASNAGLRDGDIVIGIEDQEVDDPGDVFTWMLDPGCLNREYELRFIRDGKLETTEIKVVDRNS